MQGSQLPYHIYNAYRLLVSSTLFMLLLLNWHPRFFGIFNPTLFSWTLSFYWLYSLVVLYLGKFSPFQITYIKLSTLLIDILAWILLLHASAGVTSGFGLVLISVCASAALLLPRQLAFFIAAIATLGLIGEELWIQHLMPHRLTAFSQVGGLGVLFFTLTFLIQALASRLQDTEEKAASLSKLNALITQKMEIGAIIFDLEGNLIQINPSAQQLLETTAATHIKDFPPYFQLAYHGGHLEIPSQHIRISYEKTPLYIIVFLFNTFEIERQSRQERLAALGTMASNIAHEIRNPLSAIYQSAQHLKKNDPDSELVTIIERQVKRINKVIENVLSLTRNPKPAFSFVNIKQLLLEIEESWPKDKKDISFSTEAEEILTDRAYLEQILTILIENAKRYAENISIQIDNAQEHWVLSIEDDGPGIPSEHVKYIFDPFYTLESSGTGLGLYLAKALCEACSIDIYYVNSTNGGASFKLILPKQYKDESR